MSSALLVLSSSTLCAKTSSPIQLPHPVHSKNVAIRHNVRPNLTRFRHDTRTYAQVGEQEDRPVPFRHNMVATLLAASLLVSSPAVLPAVAADSSSIDWQSLMEPSSSSSESSSPSIPAPPSSDTPVSPEERAKLLKVVLDQRQAEKEAKVREEAEARQGGGTAFRARTPAPAPVAPPVAPPVRERVAPVVTPVPAPVKAVAAEVPKVVASVRAKTHGVLPLFFSQFLLLGVFAGGIAALIKVPESKWTTLTQKVDSALEKASPVIVSVWEKSQPVAREAFALIQRVAKEASPYVVKAAKAAKPLALKAVEAAKPLLQQGQQKVEGILQSSQEELGDLESRQERRDVKGSVEKVGGKVKNEIENVGESVKEEGESVRRETEAVSRKVGGGVESDK